MTLKKKTYTCFTVLGAITFLLFAALQVNDAAQFGNNSWWIWVGLYLSVASINVLGALQKNVRTIAILFCGFFWGALVFKMQDGQGNILWYSLAPASFINPANEQVVQQTNESGGLLIAACWLSLLSLRKDKR